MASRDHAPSIAAVTSGHTPGPWELWESSDARPHTVVGPARFRFDGAFVARLVDVNHYFPSQPHYGQEQLANARLIAAAPDLYEALKGLYEEVAEAQAEDDLNLIRQATCTAARAAIAKAEVRS